MTDPREYQQRMVAEIRSRWAEGHRRVLGVLPTGGGKTEVAMTMIDGESGRVLVVVERKTLVEQWVARMRGQGVKRSIGVLQGGNTRGADAAILVATAQTISARGVPEGVGLVVIDESHIWHKTHDDVLETLTEANVLGLTATPLREGLGLRFDAVVIGSRIRELQADGFLVKARYLAPRPEAIEAALEAVSIRAGDFASNELAVAMRNKAIIGDVVAEWQRRGEDRQTIAFCVDKQHARDLANEFVTAGIAAEVVLDDTEDGDRKVIFEAFNNRAVRVLASVGVLGVGFDAPIAACAILARPTLSYSLYLQQGGRVLRPCAGKTDALILDHAGNTHRFGLLEDFEPPTDLSMVNKKTDRRSRRASSGVWTCVKCEAINTNTVTICEECGTPRRRHSAVVLLDGELVNVMHADNETLPGPTVARVREVYLMMRHYGISKEMKNPYGWAWHAVQRRFQIPAYSAKEVIPWSWRDLIPVPPDEETSRWLTAEYQRQRITQRYVQRRNTYHGDGHDDGCSTRGTA